MLQLNWGIIWLLLWAVALTSGSLACSGVACMWAQWLRLPPEVAPGPLPLDNLTLGFA